ncbi:MAG: cysteine methyltransferase [Candidatus Eisenbacteria bacterium]|nr:cysteine methyltransferase [Candidatus Eisenbacteria bacterium]
MSESRRTAAGGDRNADGVRGHHARIRDVVRKVPAGTVATYGQIAAIAGRCTPRMVGYAMASLPGDSDVPWHRVLNARGRISLGGEGAGLQRAMLEAEGIEFVDGRVDLAEFGWEGSGGGPK